MLKGRQQQSASAGILRTYVESYVSDILAAEIRADSRMSFKGDDAVYHEYIIWSTV